MNNNDTAAFGGIDVMQRLKDLILDTSGVSAAGLMRKARSLLMGLPLIAQSLVDSSSNRKIKIRRYEGFGGQTDGKTVWIMNAPLPRTNEEVDEFVLFVAISLGLLHHEVGHVNETDFSATRSTDRFEMKLENLIEDVRQENAHMRSNLSARKYLDALQLALLRLGANAVPTETTSPLGVFTAYLLYRLRAQFCDQAFYWPTVEGTEAVFKKCFTEGVLVRLEALLHRVGFLQNTTESIALAKEFAGFVKDELEQVRREQQQRAACASAAGAGDGSSSLDTNGSEVGESQADAVADSTGCPSISDSQADDEPVSADDEQQDAEPDQSNDQDSTPASPYDDSTDDQLTAIADALQKMLEGEGMEDAKGDVDQQARDALQQLSDTLEQTHETHLVEPPVESVESADVAIESAELHLGPECDLDTATSVVSRLRSRLKRELQAQSITRTDRSSRGSKLSTSKIHRVALGDPRMFQRTVDGVTVDTSVFILGDVSSSMDGQPIRLLNQALYATACAMQAMPGVEVAIGAFPMNQLVLPFGTRAVRERGRFCLAATGSTPMHEGVAMAQRALLMRRRPRRLLLVLTDGEPDSEPAAVAALDYAQSLGVEMYGIGILTDHVQHLFQRWAVVNDVMELPETMLTVLRSRLVAPAAA